MGCGKRKESKGNISKQMEFYHSKIKTKQKKKATKLKSDFTKLCSVYCLDN